MLSGADHRGRDEVAAGQPPPVPALPESSGPAPALAGTTQDGGPRARVPGRAPRCLRSLLVLLGEQQHAGAASWSPSDPGGAGRCGTACSRLRRRSASRASPAWAACSGQRRGTTSLRCLLPGRRRARGRASRWPPGRPGRPGGRGPSSPSCLAGWATARDGDRARRAVSAARAAGRRRTGVTARLARAWRSSSSAVLSEKAGISPSGGSPFHRRACHSAGSAGSWKNTARRSRRSLRITHLPLCLPPRSDSLPS